MRSHGLASKREKTTKSVDTSYIVDSDLTDDDLENEKSLDEIIDTYSN